MLPVPNILFDSPKVLGYLCSDVSVSVSVAVYVAGVDVVAALDSPDGLEADSGRLVGEDVDQPVLELVDGQVGRHEPIVLGLNVAKLLELKLHGRQRRNCHNPITCSINSIQIRVLLFNL